MRRFLPIALSAALLAGVAAPAIVAAAPRDSGQGAITLQAPVRSGLLSNIPVTGTLSNGDPFTGTLNITDITRSGTQLLFSGTVLNAAGQLVGTFTAALGTLLNGGGAACDILTLDLGHPVMQADAVANSLLPQHAHQSRREKFRIAQLQSINRLTPPKRPG